MTESNEIKVAYLLLGIGSFSQRVHVAIWYIHRAQRGSHIPTLRPKYIPYTYMDPLGLGGSQNMDMGLRNPWDIEGLSGGYGVRTKDYVGIIGFRV